MARFGVGEDVGADEVLHGRQEGATTARTGTTEATEATEAARWRGDGRSRRWQLSDEPWAAATGEAFVT